MTQDTSGLYLIGAYGGIDEVSFGIAFYYKQFPSQPSTPVVAGLTGGVHVSGLIDDPITKTYLMSGTIETGLSGVLRFAEGTNGHGTYGGPPVFTPPLVSQLNACVAPPLGPSIGGPMVLGYLRNIYIVCGNAIYVYEHDASGNATPIRILQGPLTEINAPTGLFEGK